MDAARALGLVKRFGETAAVDGVSLAVSAGEVRGLLGANGAGKTTLLRLLFGLITPDGGEVELLGTSLGGAGSAALDGVGGFVEEPTFYPYLSALDNLALLQRLDGGDPSSDRGYEVLARVGLADRARDRVGGFSTGMRQRLGIAAALLRRPRLLLLDEPTSGLDPGGSRDVARLVRRLADDGVAVLLSSHRIGELERICDAYAFMRAGRIVWEGSADALAAAAPPSAFELHTSDDASALTIAAAHPGVRVSASAPGPLTISAGETALDGLVLALGHASIAVRRLELLVSPLEAMFFALSEGEQVGALEPRELAHRASEAAAR